jgi:hypothetical protein
MPNDREQFGVDWPIILFLAGLFACGIWADVSSRKYSAGQTVRIKTNGKSGVVYHAGNGRTTVRYVDNANKINDVLCRDDELEPISSQAR